MGKLTAVSLFAGVGGFDLAMERNGIEVVADVEIDRAARSVLERRFPHSTHFNDVTEVTGEQLRDAGFVPDRGVITGGFPCQDLSVAGKRAGLAGSRSGLFWEIIRLAKELRPKFLILENVPGLLSAVCPCNGNGQCVDNGRLDRCEGEPHNVRGGACEFGCFETHGGAMGVVLGALAQLGYGIGYRVLDAQFFGVPQRRRRVFIVGCLGDDGRTPFEILALAQGVSGDSSPSEEEGQEFAGTLTGGSGERGWKGGVDGYGAYPIMRAISHGEFVPDDITSTLRSRDHKQGTVDVVVSHSLTAEYDASEDDVSLTLATGNGQVLVQPFNKVVRSGARDENGDLPAEGWRSEDVAPTLSQFDQGEVRATTLVAETLRSHPRAGSNTTGPLTSSGMNRARGTETVESHHYAEIGTAVRRLTPTECIRLQGFPDTWLEIHDGSKSEAHARQILHSVWLSAYEEAREGWRSGVLASLLTPEVLLTGVYGGWVSWEVAGRCATSRGEISGEDAWPEGFVRRLWEVAQYRPTSHRRESFEQLARELGRSLSELPLEEAQAIETVLNSRLWSQASTEQPLRYARSETEEWTASDSLADSACYRQMGNAVAVPVVEWIVRRLVRAL